MSHIVIFGVRGVITPTEPFLRPLRRRGAHVTWITEGDASPSLLAPGVETLSVEHFASEEHLCQTIDARHRRWPVTGVISFVEEFMTLAARLAVRFGLSLNSERTATVTTDKHDMRRALVAAGVPVPAFRLVTTPDAATRAAATLGFPCVIKPLRASGSRGVKVVETEDELRAAFGWTTGVGEQTGTGANALVEQYARGIEYSAELVVAGGRIVFASFTDKYLIGGAYRDEIAHVHPARLDAATTAIVRDVLQRTVTAVGIQAGGCHAEFKVDGERVLVIEIASRLGGAGIPELVRSSTGVDMLDLVYAAILGEPVSPVEVVAAPAHYYGIWFLTVDRPSRVRHTTIPRHVYGYPGVLRARIFKTAGEQLVPRDSGGERVGFVVGRHADKETLVASLRAATRDIAAAAIEVIEADDAVAPVTSLLERDVRTGPFAQVVGGVP